MTRKRADSHSTEFGLWLREQPEIDSSLGYTATNIDYVWRNYKTGQWMYIEEKRYGGWPKFYQRRSFRQVHLTASNDANYHGFHILVFEETCPDDGSIWLDQKALTKEELLLFLRFQAAAEIYERSVL